MWMTCSVLLLFGLFRTPGPRLSCKALRSPASRPAKSGAGERRGEVPIGRMRARGLCALLLVSGCCWAAAAPEAAAKAPDTEASEPRCAPSPSAALWLGCF